MGLFKYMNNYTQAKACGYQFRKDIAEKLLYGYEELCAKLYNFREAVIKNHQASGIRHHE